MTALEMAREAAVVVACMVGGLLGLSGLALLAHWLRSIPKR